MIVLTYLCKQINSQRSLIYKQQRRGKRFKSCSYVHVNVSWCRLTSSSERLALMFRTTELFSRIYITSDLMWLVHVCPGVSDDGSWRVRLRKESQRGGGSGECGRGSADSSGSPGRTGHAQWVRENRTAGELIIYSIKIHILFKVLFLSLSFPPSSSDCDDVMIPLSFIICSYIFTFIYFSAEQYYNRINSENTSKSKTTHKSIKNS